MNFTREPLIETVISAKEGHKLALRNSKGGGQEEYFVDSIEVITFGNSSFYRSLEKPKSFLVPVSDYEVIEVREPRMVLKSASVERGIKIAGGREGGKPSREEKEEEEAIQEVEPAPAGEQKVDKRRERRRVRKRRGRGEQQEEKDTEITESKQEEKPTLIPPPSTLISETIRRYKDIVIHEPLQEEEEGKEGSEAKKSEELSEEPSESSSPEDPEAQPKENDEEEVHL